VDEDPIMLDDLRYRALLALTALGRQTLAEFARHADPTKYLPHTPDRGRYKNQTIYRNPITRAWMEKLPEGYEEREGKVVKAEKPAKGQEQAIAQTFRRYQEIGNDVADLRTDQIRAYAQVVLGGQGKAVLQGVLEKLGLPTQGKTKDELRSRLLDHLLGQKSAAEPVPAAKALPPRAEDHPDVDKAIAHYQPIKDNLRTLTVDQITDQLSQLVAGFPRNVLGGMLVRMGYPPSGTKEDMKSLLLDNLMSLKISYEQRKQIGMPASRPFKTTNDQEYGPLPEHLKNLKLTPLQQDMADVTDDWLRKNRTDIPFDELYKTLQTRHQDLTPDQFKAALRFLHDQDRLRMGGWAFGPHLLPRPELGVCVGSSDREHENKLMWYLHGGSGVSRAGYYTKQPAPSPTPS
jgi:hypothetical protein